MLVQDKNTLLHYNPCTNELLQCYLKCGPQMKASSQTVFYHSTTSYIYTSINSESTQLKTFISTFSSVQFSRSVVSDSLRPHESQHARPPCPSPTPGVHPNSHPSSQWCQNLPKPMCIESVMPSSHLILCCPLLLLSPIPPSIRVFFNESTLQMRWPKYWNFSFSISPSKEIPGLIFRMNWLDLVAVQGTLKSLFQHHNSKASILRLSVFFTVQLYIHTWPLEKP